MTIKKATVRNIIESYFEEISTERTKYELVSFKAKEVEELGETLICIDAVEKMFQKIGGTRTNHWGELKETVRYIYCVDTHELMNKNYKTIWC